MRKMAPHRRFAAEFDSGSRAEARSVPNGFSTMTRAPWRRAGLAELLHHQSEQHWRNRQIVGRTLGGAELLRIAWNVAGS